METVEQIKVEELHPELVEASTENKSFKKFQKMSEKLVSKVNGRINAEREAVRKKLDNALERLEKNIDNFIKGTNEDIAKFKKRYEAMYTHLVREVMLKQEQRVFSAELFEQATLDLFVDKIYKLENKVDYYENVFLEHINKSLPPEVEEIKKFEFVEDKIGMGAYIEDCAELHESFMQKHANAFAKKQKEERDAAMAMEKEKEETEDSRGTEDSGSSEADTENSGTTNQADGGEAQSAPSQG